MLPETIAFVDIETTGMRIVRDRIIEIGILRVEKNKIIRKYQTLIHPQMYIPDNIAELTGITKEELERAPTFYQVKDEILEVLDNCVFAAHNVRFDYGFIKNEFNRLGISFRQKHFCTVRLSRYLYPQYSHHALDNIIERFGLLCKRRHRAFDDAKAIYDFFKIAKKKTSKEKFENALSKALKRPSLPTRLSASDLENLPEKPGVYIFYAENGMPLYIGKSINLKDRILSHFSNDHASPLDMKISQSIKSLETIETEGELGALFKEAELIKKMQPLYNRKLRIKRNLTVVKTTIDKNGYQTVIFETYDQIDTKDLESIVGIFPSRKRAKDFLISAAKEYGLCERILGIDTTLAACFAYRLGKCKGACVGEEDTLRYNMRFILAFSKNKIKPWPFKGVIAIENLLFNKWCFLGKKSPNEDTQTNMIFDVDTYKILESYLRVPKHIKEIKVL